MLTPDQQAALLPIYSFDNLAISGQAGTGKTFLLKELWRGLSEDKCVFLYYARLGWVLAVFGRGCTDSSQV